MDEAYARRLAEKLSAEEISRSLINAGLFLCAYELLKAQVIENVRGFFFLDNDQYDAKYASDVLARDPTSRFRASCSWLVAVGALAVEQSLALERIHRHRHEIAHELPRLLVDTAVQVDVELLAEAVGCIRALAVFWGRITVETDPYWGGRDVADEEIESGASLLMQHLIAVTTLTVQETASSGGKAIVTGGAQCLQHST